MKTRTLSVYGAGRIERSDILTDGEGMRIARRFLDALAVQVAKNCVRFHEYTGELAFAYGERQIHSILFPAILANSDVASTELPVTRKPWGGDESTGRVDYWVRVWKTVILLEVKHGYHAARSTRLRDRSQIRWKQVVKQANSLPTGEVRGQAFARDKLLVIGLFVVPTRTRRNRRDRLRELAGRSVAEVLNDHRTIASSLKGAKPSWSACWVVPKERRIQSYGAHMHEIYAGVNLFAFVRQVRR